MSQTLFPMEVLKAISPVGARTHLEHRDAIMAEMTEAILVSRFMKAATVNDAATEALHRLQQNPADAERL